MSLAVYCRVSTPQQADNSSFESQEKQGRQYAAQVGETNPAIYKDVFSGTQTAGRKDWLRLLDNIKRGMHERVLYFSLDRLARRTIDGLQFLDVLEQYKVELHKFGVGRIDYTDPNVKLLLTMEFAFAEKEVKEIKRRTGKGKIDTINAGKGRYKELYGYLPTKEFSSETGKRIWIQEPEEIKAVLAIYDWVIRDHLSLHAICKKLNGLGYKPRHSKYWNSSTVSHILKQPAYCGKMRHTEGYLIDAAKPFVYEPIIDFPYWKKAQDLYAPCITSKQNNGYAVVHPMTNVIHCAYCKAAFMINQSVQKYEYKTSPGKVRVTKRISYFHDSKVPCTKQYPKYLYYDLINWIGEDVFLKALSEKDNTIVDGLVNKAVEDSERFSMDANRIKEMIATLDREIKNYEQAIAEGLEISRAVRLIQEREATKREYENTIHEIEKASKVQEEHYRKLRAEFAIENIITYLKSKPRSRRDAIKRLLESAIIKDSEIVFTLIDGRVYTYNYSILRQNENRMNLRGGAGLNPTVFVALTHLRDVSEDSEVVEEAERLLVEIAKKKVPYQENQEGRKSRKKKK